MIMEEASVSTAPLQAFLANNLKGLSRRATLEIGSELTIKKFIENRRIKACPEKYASNPWHIEHLVIPEDLETIKINKEQQPFLMYDSGESILPNRIIIFSTIDRV